MNNLTSLASEAYRNAVIKGFHPEGESEDAFVERMCNLLHSEVSEIYEAWRNNQLREPCDKASKMNLLGCKPLSCLEEELADIIIRVLDNAVHLGVDIEVAVTHKMKFNQTREFRHGNKKS